MANDEAFIDLVPSPEGMLQSLVSWQEAIGKSLLLAFSGKGYF